MRWSFKHKRFDIRVSVGILGVVIMTIAMQTIAGYIFGDESYYTWVGPIGMALNTAIEFLFCGAAFTLISLSQEIWNA